MIYKYEYEYELINRFTNKPEVFTAKFESKIKITYERIKAKIIEIYEMDYKHRYIFDYSQL